MLKRVFAIAGGLAVAVAFTGCEATKSSNPLAPTVAGPIPGVNITAPAVVDPSSGAKIPMDKQPITLTVVNASTIGRSAAQLRVRCRDGRRLHEQGLFARRHHAGRRAHQPAPARCARDRPQLLLARARAGRREHRPLYRADQLQRLHAGRHRRAGPDRAAGELHSRRASGRRSSSETRLDRAGRRDLLSNRIGGQRAASPTSWCVWTQGEQPTQTSLAPRSISRSASVYFWHARAFDPTDRRPVVADTDHLRHRRRQAGPRPAHRRPSCPARRQAMRSNLAQAAVYNSPPDIASWPATGTITNLTMSPGAGLSFAFTTSNSWPDVIPPGFSGPLEYTVWAVVNVNGRWTTSGFIQMWRGRASTGAPILSDFALNWAYDARWGPMNHYQPHPGEQMGFFLSAGQRARRNRRELGEASARTWCSCRCRRRFRGLHASRRRSCRSGDRPLRVRMGSAQRFLS